jgi:hypothetical protein
LFFAECSVGGSGCTPTAVKRYLYTDLPVKQKLAADLDNDKRLTDPES